MLLDLQNLKKTYHTAKGDVRALDDLSIRLAYARAGADYLPVAAVEFIDPESGQEILVPLVQLPPDQDFDGRADATTTVRNSPTRPIRSLWTATAMATRSIPVRVSASSAIATAMAWATLATTALMLRTRRRLTRTRTASVMHAKWLKVLAPFPMVVAKTFPKRNARKPAEPIRVMIQRV